MDGEQSRENCLKDFHHPFRTKYQFDKRIDDFSLATIALQLYAIAIQPDLFSLSQNNSLLLTRDDYVNLSNSSMFSRLMKLICYEDFEKLISCASKAKLEGDYYYLFSTAGFDQWLVDAAAKSDGKIRLIGIDELTNV